MTKEKICPRCGELRPPWQGYCNPCRRKYQRDRYRKVAATDGREVYGMDERAEEEDLERQYRELVYKPPTSEDPTS